MQLVLTPELLIEAYKQGLFPMAYNGDSPYVHWICPDERGQLPIFDLHISKSLKKLVRKNLKRDAAFNITVDTAFEAVMRECAASRLDRPETWINEPIIKAYCALHERGYAHSVECRDADGKLVGGLYGVAIGGAFFGESMFSRVSNASKIALVHLCARLCKGGFNLLDTQFVNEHLKQFGVYEVSHGAYIERLRTAVKTKGNFELDGLDEAEIVEWYFSARKGLAD
ncbi:MAG: leucyl/phenylalanyl-tRNA--protein transferase [Alphaproteobacteria bacterium]|nr:leucyl/phenylalanyl-tRNA--protein transferase [Alphaproteobacteria bacterium]